MDLAHGLTLMLTVTLTGLTLRYMAILGLSFALKMRTLSFPSRIWRARVMADELIEYCEHCGEADYSNINDKIADLVAEGHTEECCYEMAWGQASCTCGYTGKNNGNRP
jgi:hypothetical protein